MQQMVVECIADGNVYNTGKTVTSVMVQILHHFNRSTPSTTELVAVLYVKNIYV